MPKISIVLPIYNGERYIKEAIESILNQSYGDWELIIVNDASTDSTSDILDEFSRRDKRIKVVNNENNLKLPKSLNRGFSFAKGEYLTWTSDDNVYLEEAFEKMVNYLDSHKEVPMVVANMNTMDEDGNVLEMFQKYDANMMYYNNQVGACFMYRNSVIRDVGEYNPDMFLVEDYEYWLRILIYYGEIGHIDECLYSYRKHQKSLTMTKRQEIKKQLIKLRRKYWSSIVKHYAKQPAKLCGIALDLYEDGGWNKEEREQLLLSVPELNLLVEYNTNEKLIVYGAGVYGDYAFQTLGNKITYYTDINTSLVGTKKHGIEIISLDQMIRKVENYQLMIALSYEKIYEVLMYLKQNGVAKCCVYHEKL